MVGHGPRSFASVDVAKAGGDETVATLWEQKADGTLNLLDNAMLTNWPRLRLHFDGKKAIRRRRYLRMMARRR
jgi:hypothetical protein